MVFGFSVDHLSLSLSPTQVNLSVRSIMNFPTCSLWIFVARTDVAFMMHTIPHILRMSHFPFEERVLAIDTAPLSGDKLLRPGIGTMEELRTLTQNY